MLPDKYHFMFLTKISGFDGVEINAACHRLAGIVQSLPDNLVAAGLLVLIY
jgi:hypothetical protein